jgi:hypothetical protein
MLLVAVSRRPDGKVFALVTVVVSVVLVLQTGGASTGGGNVAGRW